MVSGKFEVPEHTMMFSPLRCLNAVFSTTPRAAAAPTAPRKVLRVVGILPPLTEARESLSQSNSIYKGLVPVLARCCRAFRLVLHSTPRSFHTCRLNPEGILSRVDVAGHWPNPNPIVTALQEAAMKNLPNSGNSKEGHADNLAAETRAGHEAGASTTFSPSDRRAFLQGAAAAAAATAATLAMPRWAQAYPGDFDAIRAEVEKRHDESVKRLQD